MQGLSASSGTAATTPSRRVRHGVRDGLAVMAFSASASVGFALLMLLVTRLLAGAGN